MMLESYLKKKNEVIVIEISSDEEHTTAKYPINLILQPQKQKCKQEPEKDSIFHFTPFFAPTVQVGGLSQQWVNQQEEEQQQKSPLPQYVHQMQIQESSNEYIYEQQCQIYQEKTKPEKYQIMRQQKAKPVNQQFVRQKKSQKKVMQSEIAQPDISTVTRNEEPTKCSLEVRRTLLRNIMASIIAKKQLQNDLY